MKIKETVHHGNYRAERVVELPGMFASSVARMFDESPYGVQPAARMAVWSELKSEGRAEHGWTTWEVLA